MNGFFVRTTISFAVFSSVTLVQTQSVLAQDGFDTASSERPFLRPTLKSNRVIVKKKEMGLATMDGHRGQDGRKSPHVKFVHEVKVGQVSETVNAYKQDPSVIYAEEDQVLGVLGTPVNDPFFSDQWHYLKGAGGIFLESAWDVTTGSEDIVIAVLDTGLGPHPEFASRTVPGADFVSDENMGNDGDGRDMDPTDPGDWISNSDDCFQGFSYPSSWHGTHVAGTIGASTANGQGVAGINRVSKILPVRVLGKCGGFTSDIIAGMRWAAGLEVEGMPKNENPAQVINMSLGAPGSCTKAMQEAINEVRDAGSVIVVAAGNSNTNIDLASFTPANCQGVITVGAVNSQGDRASYSNYGKEIDVAGPGGENWRGVLSTSDSGQTSSSGPTYKGMAGTSMAAPHVAGIASLILSVNKDLKVHQVIEIIKETASEFASFSTCNERCGTGLVNAYEAVLRAEREIPAEFDDYNPDPVVNNDGPEVLASTGDGGGCGTIDLGDGDGPGGNGQFFSLLLGVMLMMSTKIWGKVSKKN